MRSTCLGLAIV